MWNGRNAILTHGDSQSPIVTKDKETYPIDLLLEWRGGKICTGFA